MKYIIFVSVVSVLIVFSAQNVSFCSSQMPASVSSVQTTDEFNEDDDFSPGLLFFTLIGFAFVLACVAAGIVLLICILSTFFALVSFGIISTSIVIGLYKKSYSGAFKTFIVLTSTTGGVLFCGIGFWLLNKITHWYSGLKAIGAGAGFGFLAGLLFGFVLFYILKRSVRYFKVKLNLM